MIRTSIGLAMVTGCFSGPAYQPPKPLWTRHACSTVHVVDVAGKPLAGVAVHRTTVSRSCGPSMMPEGCFPSDDEGKPVTTDASGVAVACSDETDSMRASSITAELDGWPTAGGEAMPQVTLTMGPPHTAIVELAPACDPTNVRVSASGRPGVAVRGNRFTIAGLGPWSYWVRNDVLRSGTACKSFVRLVDGRDLSTIVALDRSDVAIALPEFAGATVTFANFRESEPIGTGTLDATGSATIALPITHASAVCMRVTVADKCLVTYARAGELTVPGMYADRAHDLEAQCGTCPLL